MVRIILHGCCGAMGKVISQLASEDENVKIVAGIDIVHGEDKGYPVYTDPDDCMEEADVIVDFSVAIAVDRIVAYALKRELPLVMCTTGLDERQKKDLKKASEKIAVLRSANMSLGVNTVFRLAAMAAEILAERGYDMEIVEKHHHRKLDAPSGTAFAIAEAINEALDGSYSYKLDRSSERKKRDEKEIGIQALRGGNIVGEHELFFCGTDEVIEIKHTAYSRAIFGKGALSAAIFLKGKAPGIYSMKDVL